MRRIEIEIRQTTLGLFPSICGRYPLHYTFSVPSTARPLQIQATPLMPEYIQRLVPSHAPSEAGSVPKSLPGPFDHTLARGLGLKRHCIEPLSAISSRKGQQTIYRLSIVKRLLLLEALLEAHCSLVEGYKGQLEVLQEQYVIARLIATLQGPICYLPSELLEAIFLISVEQYAVPWETLQRVSRTWRDLVPRLRVGTWTREKRIRDVIKANPLSMAVVIDTAMDEALSFISKKPYAALALTWTSALRWRSLAIDSFPSSTSALASNVPVYPLVPLKNLESLYVGPGCNSSGCINETLAAIAFFGTPKLTSLTLAATSVFRQLNHSHWAHNYSQLTVLEVYSTKIGEPVDLLRHCSRLEVLKLSGVISHPLSPDDELPLLQTLRQLWLQQASIQWMAGRVFERLASCTLLRPVDRHTILQASITTLPICTSIRLQSHLIRILAAFHAPIVNSIIIECSEWRKPRANLELRVWDQSWEQRMSQLKVLSLNISCGDQVLLEVLQQMVILERLRLDLPHPSALGARFFEAMCALPTSTFTGRSKDEWLRWVHSGTQWRVRICPCLYTIKLQYARWLRKGEMDLTTPLFIAVAWTREQLRFPLQQFSLTLEQDKPLELVGMTPQDPTFMNLWRHAKVPVSLLSYAGQELLCIGSITRAINQTLGFVEREPALPFRELGRQYYSSFFRRLRAFHHHPILPPTSADDILPFFEQLEELDITNFDFEPCPAAVDLPLCRTLRILYLNNTALSWMDGRIFKRVVECRIVVYDDERIGKLSRVEMPACTKMEFSQGNNLKILASFHLDSLLLGISQEGRSPDSLCPVQLLVRSVRPQVLRMSKGSGDKNLITTSQSEIGGEVVVELSR